MSNLYKRNRYKEILCVCDTDSISASLWPISFIDLSQMVILKQIPRILSSVNVSLHTFKGGSFLKLFHIFKITEFHNIFKCQITIHIL